MQHVLPEHDPLDSARRVFAFARSTLAAARRVRMPHDGTPPIIRIGIHTGVKLEGEIQKFEFGSFCRVCEWLQQALVV